MMRRICFRERPLILRPLEVAPARCSKLALLNQARLDRRDPSLGFTQRLDACVHGVGAQDKVVIMRDSRANYELCIGLASNSIAAFDGLKATSSPCCSSSGTRTEPRPTAVHSTVCSAGGW